MREVVARMMSLMYNEAMAKAQIKKQKRVRRPLLATLLGFVVFVLLLLLINFFWSLDMKIHGNSNEIYSLKQRTTALEFCVDHQISPCTNEKLQQWNNTHSETWQKYLPYGWPQTVTQD